MSAVPPPLPSTPEPAPQISLEEYLSRPVYDGGKIVSGTEGMSLGAVEDDILQGGRFVIFLWNFSLVILSFRRGSSLTYVRSSEWVGPKSLMWSLLSLCIGPWGIPWGVIFTITSLYTNCKGGKDVTPEVLKAVLGNERAAGILARRPAPKADPILWFLRIICLTPLIMIAYFAISSFTDFHPSR